MLDGEPSLLQAPPELEGFKGFCGVALHVGRIRCQKNLEFRCGHIENSRNPPRSRRLGLAIDAEDGQTCPCYRVPVRIWNLT